MRPLFVLMLTLAAAPAAAGTFVVSGDDCRRAIRHVPDAGVAYTPGVDARGRPVVPADLGGAPPIRVSERIVIPITIDIGRRMGLLYTSEAFVGLVEYRDGRFWYDGQPLQDEAEAELLVRCRATVGAR